MNARFVACTCISCPMNGDKQCRAPFLMVDEDGHCLIKDAGPYTNKAPTESYVDIMECRCKSCQHNEKDESMATPRFVCGLGEDLFFKLRQVNDKEVALCHAYEKQVTNFLPGFAPAT